jgi:hypothetical protein
MFLLGMFVVIVIWMFLFAKYPVHFVSYHIWLMKKFCNREIKNAKQSQKIKKALDNELRRLLEL